MINSCCIFTTGGIVLWNSQYDTISSKILCSFVNDSLVSNQRSVQDQSYQTNGYTVKYTTINDLELIITAVYHSILQLPYVEEFLDNVRTIFAALFADELRIQKETTGNLSIDNESSKVKKFTSMINARKKELEAEYYSNNTNNQQTVDIQPVSEHQIPEKIDTGVSSATTDETTKEKSRRHRGGKKKNQEKSSANNGSGGSKSKKQLRKWGINGEMEEDDPDAGPLDYSSTSFENESSGYSDQQIISDTVQDIDNWGSTQKSGEFVLKELHTILDEKPNQASSKESFGFLKNMIGGKTLSEEDLDKALAEMETHLLKKNIAKEAADHLCDVVRTALLGLKTKNWTSVQTTVRNAMADALRRILTPNSSVDLLHEIDAAKKKSSRPYVISVVGVNGVGKSTNLSKLAFWLLQNKKKVLIAACDTFRSGAVEQLKVHVDRLQKLTERLGSGRVEIFSEGYGKDAAAIAQKAVEFGKRGNFDVVLIDTAGRRHNDTRLMSSLENFGKLANPDKMIMVGEALVGTDSVQQARNFNAAFGPKRNLDFFLISKCDTVGDMIGSLVNMTYSTGIPVLFVGTGQNYTDLRTLSIDWAVNLLME